MLLLDTCTVLWLAADQARLSSHAKHLLPQRAGRLFVSAISAFEIAIKHRKGALRLPRDPEGWYAAVLVAHGLLEIPVTGRLAAQSVALPTLHADPADRMIVATALAHGLTILTPDPLIAAYPKVHVDW